MRYVSITTSGVDVRLLRKQRNWVLTLPACDEREGLTNLLDHLLDRAEGYPDTPNTSRAEDPGKTLLRATVPQLTPARTSTHGTDSDLRDRADGEIVSPLPSSGANAVERLDDQENLVVLVFIAARDAAREHETAASHILALARDFLLERKGAAMGDGPILRLERWWDQGDDGGPLTCERGDVSLLAATVDPEQARGYLEQRGYHDASDPSQPMAALWVRLGALTRLPLR